MYWVQARGHTAEIANLRWELGNTRMTLAKLEKASAAAAIASAAEKHSLTENLATTQRKLDSARALAAAERAHLRAQHAKEKEPQRTR